MNETCSRERKVQTKQKNPFRTVHVRGNLPERIPVLRRNFNILILMCWKKHFLYLLKTHRGKRKFKISKLHAISLRQQKVLQQLYEYDEN